MMPLGTYTKAIRTGAFERVAASAGTMASRKGSATAVPMPRRNVRRGKDFLVIIVELPLCWSGSGDPLQAWTPAPHRHGPFEMGRCAQCRKSAIGNQEI